MTGILEVYSEDSEDSTEGVRWPALSTRFRKVNAVAAGRQRASSTEITWVGRLPLVVPHGDETTSLGGGLTQAEEGFQRGCTSRQSMAKAVRGQYVRSDGPRTASTREGRLVHPHGNPFSSWVIPPRDWSCRHRAASPTAVTCSPRLFPSRMLAAGRARVQLSEEACSSQHTALAQSTDDIPCNTTGTISPRTRNYHADLHTHKSRKQLDMRARVSSAPSAHPKTICHGALASSSQDTARRNSGWKATCGVIQNAGEPSSRWIKSDVEVRWWYRTAGWEDQRRGGENNLLGDQASGGSKQYVDRSNRMSRCGGSQREMFRND